MRYFQWIRDYREGELSAADRQAFEHEIEDNTRLRAEIEAVELVDLLLAEASMNSTSKSQEATSVRRLKHWKIAAVVLVLGLLTLSISVWLYPSVSSQPTPILEHTSPNVEQDWNLLFAPGKQKPVDNPLPPMFEQTTAPMADKGLEKSEGRKSINHQRQKAELASLEKSAVPPPITKYSSAADHNGLPTTDSKAVILYTVQAVLDSTLSRESSLALTATERITLRPGFHAKAGTSFKAKVDNGPLFQKTSEPND